MSNKWYTKVVPNSDIYVSTRIRLARNVKQYPFPSRLDVTGRSELCEILRNIVLDSEQLSHHNFTYIDMPNINVNNALSMVERHLISKEFAAKRQGALLLSQDESICILLCEEDHIRIQVLSCGSMLEESYKIADQIDDIISNKVEYAFDKRLGYLTECPTNLGTGLRASIMLHLPAMESSNNINKLIETVSKIGLTIRGTYGEGSSSVGSLYQLSNQVTLGISEKTALANLHSIAVQVVEQEMALRFMMNENGKLSDRCSRALGVLKYALLLSSEEFMQLISSVRLGIALGDLNNISIETVNKLLFEAGSAMVQLNTNATHELERNKIRAQIVKANL